MKDNGLIDILLKHRLGQAQRDVFDA